MAGGILGPVEVVEGIAIGTGVGQAIGDVVTPKLQDFKNARWVKYPNRPLDPGQAALAAIKGFDTKLKLAEEAAKSGYAGDVFGVLEQNLRAHPDLPVALTLWRRGYIGYDDIDTYLQRHGFDGDIRLALIGKRDGLGHLKNQRLAPAQIALGIVRSIIKDPGLMPVTLDTSGGVVKAYPVSDIDAVQEAADNGFNKEHLRVLVGEIGLPMSNQQAASALFRQIIKKPDYYRAILEGDTRPEWADAILGQARQILTANQYAELELRGFLSRGERREHTAKHGMSDADSDRLFDVLGRSIPVHQIVTGEARGGKYKPPPATLDEQTAGIPADALASLQRGNLRPEYYNLAYANRYTYPSGFMIRGLAQDGELTEVETKDILLEVGWKPELATKFAKRWAGGTGAAADPNVKKAQTQLWSATHRSFVNSEIGDADAEGAFDQLAIPAEAHPEIIGLWSAERDMVRKQLTPAQLKKAFAEAVTNPATGQPWSRFEVLNRLTALGMSFEDAETFLEL